MSIPFPRVPHRVQWLQEPSVLVVATSATAGADSAKGIPAHPCDANPYSFPALPDTVDRQVDAIVGSV